MIFLYTNQERKFHPQSTRGHLSHLLLLAGRVDPRCSRGIYFQARDVVCFVGMVSDRSARAHRHHCWTLFCMALLERNFSICV